MIKYHDSPFEKSPIKNGGLAPVLGDAVMKIFRSKLLDFFLFH